MDGLNNGERIVDYNVKIRLVVDSKGNVLYPKDPLYSIIPKKIDITHTSIKGVIIKKVSYLH